MRPSGPGLQAQWVASVDGCNLFGYEYYGWHVFARCGDGVFAPGYSQAVQLVFQDGDCRVYRFEYNGTHHFAHCEPAAATLPPQPSQLTRPIETVAAIGDCRIGRFEYYGWHHLAECNRPAMRTDDLVTVEPLFSFFDCNAYSYEHYGWHYVIRCEPQRRQRPLPSKLGEPIQTVGMIGACMAHRFEYYGWHDFVRCPDQPVTTVLSPTNCPGRGIPAGPVTIHPMALGYSPVCVATDDTVVTVGQPASVVDASPAPALPPAR